MTPAVCVRRVSFIAVALLAQVAGAVYRDTAPRALAPGEVAVSGPGVYAEAGKTYVLTRDITAPGSAIHLGKDVVLDLNGHTLTYDGAPYQPVPNGSFEDGMAGWDVSQAPNARAEDRRWRNPMVGNRVCILPKGEEIVSPYITLPVADRAYYAMVAVASHETAVGVWVEDEGGRQVECVLKAPFGDRKCCPETNRAPKLGGGVVFALMFNQPAGKYRIRVKANNRDCIIDDVDIRPALSTGIGVVGEIMPWAYYKSVLDGDDTAFFELSPLVSAERAKTVPAVTGKGTITIRNGTVKGGAKGIRTWGLLSTARDVRLTVENVRFVAHGINANAMRFADGSITHCRTEIDSPWIIDRHRQADYTVNLTGGADGPVVTDSAFIGGQGQVSIRGAGGEVARNLFVNRQTVVNHYSLGAGSGTKIHHNRFHPEQGSAILAFGSSDTEIYENDFKIRASPPVNEYADTIYSVSAIRLTDYNKRTGAHLCMGSRIHNNRFEITGRQFPEALKAYAPSAHGIYMSVGGGTNTVYDNDFIITNLSPPNHCERGSGAFAFFIGGSDEGGVYHHNRIVCNDTPVWIANTYGPAGNTTLYNNVFTCSVAEGQQPYAPVWLGWWKNQTTNVVFISNRFEGVPFSVQINDYAKYEAGYTLGWTLTVRGAAGATATVTRVDGTQVAEGVADAKGVWTVRLAEFEEHGEGRGGRQGTEQRLKRTDLSHYRVTVGAETRTVQMDQDRDCRIGL